MTGLRIGVIGISENYSNLLKQELSKHYSVHFERFDELPEWIECDVIFAGADENGEPAIKIAEILLKKGKHIPVIAISDVKKSSSVRSTLRSGVRDWIAEGEFYRITAVVEREILLSKQKKISKWNISYVKEHNLLTDLPNLYKFQKEINKIIKEGIPFAVVIIDLNLLDIMELEESQISETLIKIAENILRNVNSEDLVAHIEHSKFAIATKNIVGIYSMLQNIQNSIGASIPSHFTMNAGASVFPYDAKDVQTLIKNTEIALMKSKEDKRNNFLFYNPYMKETLSEWLKVINKLQKSRFKEEDELMLYYQPIFDIKKEKFDIKGEKNIIGYEVLLRFKDPFLSSLSIPKILEAADKIDMLIRIEKWVLYNACLQAKKWKDSGLDLKVSVNISPRHIYYWNIYKTIEGILKEVNLDPTYLTIEITEDIPLESIEVSKLVLQKVKDIGVEIAIDDFGTKYNSIRYLKSLPFSMVKIDDELLRDIPQSKYDNIIVSNIIKLTHDLGKIVVAEGVENAYQLEFLKEAKCDYAQGFLFSPPLPVDKL